MRRLSGEAENLSWLLNNLSRTVPEVVHAVVLSADGLLLAASEHLDRTSADQLAAVASGFNSLARGAGRHFGGGGAPDGCRDGAGLPLRDRDRGRLLPGRAGRAGQRHRSDRVRDGAPGRSRGAVPDPGPARRDEFGLATLRPGE